MKVRRNSGYSVEVARHYVDNNSPLRSLSSDLESQYRYENDKRTDEVIGYKAWFTQEGLDPFAVKFEHQIKLPKYMSLIEFDNLQAIEIRYNVYFKADGLSEVK